MVRPMMNPLDRYFFVEPHHAIPASFGLPPCVEGAETLGDCQVAWAANYYANYHAEHEQEIADYMQGFWQQHAHAISENEENGRRASMNRKHLREEEAATAADMSLSTYCSRTRGSKQKSEHKATRAAVRHAPLFLSHRYNGGDFAFGRAVATSPFSIDPTIVDRKEKPYQNTPLGVVVVAKVIHGLPSESKVPPVIPLQAI